MTPEQKQRLDQIRERQARYKEEPYAPDLWWDDTNFLLSLVKEQEACWRGLDNEDKEGEMTGLYTSASVVVDNLSKDLSALRSENVLMRAVVDAATTYTVEFKTGMTDIALQKLAVAVNAYNDAQADETGVSQNGMPPVLWVSSNNQGGCFDARRHNQCTDDCRYLLASQVDAAYTDALTT